MEIKKRVKLYLSFVVAVVGLSFVSLETVSLDDLKQIRAVPYYQGLEAGGDTLFWDIAKRYKDTPEALLNAFEYRHKTYFIPWENYTYTQGYDGDIAVIVFHKLIHDIPIAEFVREHGFQTMGKMIHSSPEKNRTLLYGKIQKWYFDNKENLIWVEDKSIYHDMMQNPLGGCYRLKSLSFDTFPNRCL